MKWIKRVALALIVIVLLGGGYVAYQINARLFPKPDISSSPTTIIGFNHIGITVLDLDKMLDFYQNATGYELLKTTNVIYSPEASAFYAVDSIGFRSATLRGPNMLLELTEFVNQTDTIPSKMPAYGPGMTHTCFQSMDRKSGYQQFREAGVEMLSRGSEPVDLGGYGMTYAYAHDPEGNMVELEQMSEKWVRLKIGMEWAENNPIWMTQVALITPDLPKLTDFYRKVLAIEPYRIGSHSGNPGFDAIANLDSVAFNAAWFGLDTQGKKMELMQYVNPATPKIVTKRKPTDLGYTFSFEVLDINEEYTRLKQLGIEFLSEPQKLGDFWSVLAYDVDGNLFSLRQAVDPNSGFSLKNF